MIKVTLFNRYISKLIFRILIRYHNLLNILLRGTPNNTEFAKWFHSICILKHQNQHQYWTQNYSLLTSYRVTKTIFWQMKCLYLLQFWSLTKILEYGKVYFHWKPPQLYYVLRNVWNQEKISTIFSPFFSFQPHLLGISKTPPNLNDLQTFQTSWIIVSEFFFTNFQII